LVAARWADVEAVAQALLARGELSYREVLAVLRIPDRHTGFTNTIS